MTTDPSATEPKPSSVKRWARTLRFKKATAVAFLAAPIILAGGCASTVGDDGDSPTPVEESSTVMTTEKATPTKVAAPETTSPEPEPTTESAAETKAEATSKSEAPVQEVYYENCDAARAAGAAPVRKGDPGYRAGLDGDGDGVGCESTSSGGGGGGGGGGSGGDSGGGDDSSDVYYKNCDAVRAAGAAPIHRGDPGYAKHLDRDGDGVGCE